MAVDNGSNAMPAGDEALPLQRGENIPQLRPADAQLFRQNTLSGKTLAGGIFAVLHVEKQLRADGFRLGRMVAHCVHLS